MSLQYYVICDWCGKILREQESGDIDELHFCDDKCEKLFDGE